MLTDMRGIAIAGSILLDKIHEISVYPKEGELTKISKMSYAVGGCVPNVAIDIKVLRNDIPVYAFGKVGNDADGKFVCDTLSDYGIDTEYIRKTDDNTSFTDVMSIPGGQRTFFTYPGASSDFGFSDIPFDVFEKENIGYLHLGYFLLLDKIDKGEGALILKEAEKLGIETSIDLVSENSDRYGLVLPCLPYVDNLIINEVEAGKLCNIEPCFDNLYDIALSLKNAGVKKRVIIHMPEISVCLSESGFTSLPSFSLPSGFIKGTTGAGDAFCAACILGICEKKSDLDILSFASCAAVAALSSPDSVSGMRSEEEVKELCKPFARRNNK